MLALRGVLGAGRAAAQAGGTYFSAGPMPAVAQPAPGAPTLALPKPTEPAAARPGGPAGLPQVVRGLVLDATQGDPLPGVAVLVLGTTRGTSTGPDGRFELALPAADAAGTLAVSFIGYSTQRLPLATLGTQPLTLKLAADTQGLLGEVVLVGGYSVRKPWPWHPRALYRWSRYQLLRPFRR